MGKASRRKSATRESHRSREAHPHDAARTVDQPAPFVGRPFEGLVGETDWVALREFVPAATGTVRLSREAFGRISPEPREGSPSGDTATAAGPTDEAMVATVLPLAWSGMRRNDGQVFVALQSGTTTGDASRDVAEVLLSLTAAEPGTPLPAAAPATASSPRLQDVLDPGTPFEVTVHEGFGFWVDDVEGLDEEAAASLERANATAVPTTKLESVPSAYWCRVGDRTHLRWVLPHVEDDATDALARLHARGESTFGDGTRLLGAFRACGLLVPVWDLDPALEAEDYEKAAAEMATRLDAALAEPAALTAEERRARAGLLSRQITLR